MEHIVVCYQYENAYGYFYFKPSDKVNGKSFNLEQNGWIIEYIPICAWRIKNKNK